MLRLPLELLTAIADLLDDKSDLLSLAYASKHLYSVSIPILWKSLVVNQLCVSRTLNDHEQYFEDIPFHMHSYQSFKRSIRNNWISSLALASIQELTVTLPPSELPSQMVTAEIVRNKFATRLRKVYVIDSPGNNMKYSPRDLFEAIAERNKNKSKNQKIEIVIYNTRQARIDQMIQTGVVDSVKDLDISLNHNSSDEYTDFATALKRMSSQLARLTIHDLHTGFTDSLPAESVNLEFCKSLKSLTSLTHLSLPNSMSSSFRPVWIPNSTTSLVLHTHFPHLWRSYTSDTELNNGDNDLHLTSLQLSIPHLDPKATLCIPIHTLTSLDLWTESCATQFTSSLIQHNPHLKTIRLSHCSSEILDCIAEFAPHLEALIVDDLNYLMGPNTSSSIIRAPHYIDDSFMAAHYIFEVEKTARSVKRLLEQCIGIRIVFLTIPLESVPKLKLPNATKRLVFVKDRASHLIKNRLDVEAHPVEDSAKTRGLKVLNTYLYFLRHQELRVRMRCNVWEIAV